MYGVCVVGLVYRRVSYNVIVFIGCGIVEVIWYVFYVIVMVEMVKGVLKVDNINVGEEDVIF